MNQSTSLATSGGAPGAKPSKAWRHQIHFIVAVVILGLAAVGLNAATQMLQLHFKKIAIPLKAPLDDPKHGLAHRIGPWQMVSIDTPLDPDMESNLGTKQYVFRDYVDTRKVTERELAVFTDKSAMERRGLLMQLQGQKPDAVMNIAVTYYTGLVDTIPHVPEVCYVADGYQPVDPTSDAWDVTSPQLAGAKLPVRFIQFEDQTGVRALKRSVAYFFQTQGHYECDPLRTRFHMQKLTERESYFAKVELMTQIPDREQSIAKMQEFLSVALPEVERCLPDYKKLMNDKAAGKNDAAGRITTAASAAK